VQHEDNQKMGNIWLDFLEEKTHVRLSIHVQGAVVDSKM